MCNLPEITVMNQGFAVTNLSVNINHYRDSLEDAFGGEMLGHTLLG